MSQTYEDWLETESYQDMIGEGAVNDVLDCLRGDKPGEALAMLEEAIEYAWRMVMAKELASADAQSDFAVDPANPYRKVPPAEVERRMREWEGRQAA